MMPSAITDTLEPYCNEPACQDETKQGYQTCASEDTVQPPLTKPPLGFLLQKQLHTFLVHITTGSVGHRLPLNAFLTDGE